MNFTQAQIERLLVGDIVVLTAPKKECEYDFPFSPIHQGKNEIEYVTNKTGKLKFQVGRDYAVMQKGKSMWHCSKCGVQQTEKEMEECWGSALYGKITTNKNKITSFGYECPYCDARASGLFQSLRFVVKKITSKDNEWLLEVEKK